MRARENGLNEIKEMKSGKRNKELYKRKEEEKPQKCVFTHIIEEELNTKLTLLCTFSQFHFIYFTRIIQMAVCVHWFVVVHFCFVCAE